MQAELTARPADAHVNVKLVQLFNQDGRLDEAVKHCLAAEKRGMLRNSLDWYRVVLHTLQVRAGQLSHLHLIWAFCCFFLNKINKLLFFVAGVYISAQCL